MIDLDHLASLAPIGLAAIAYHDRGYEPTSAEMYDDWQKLERAVAEWRSQQ